LLLLLLLLVVVVVVVVVVLLWLVASPWYRTAKCQRISPCGTAKGSAVDRTTGASC
jgi:hypothetical protein